LNFNQNKIEAYLKEKLFQTQLLQNKKKKKEKKRNGKKISVAK